MYKEFLKKLQVTINKTELKESKEIADIIGKRLVIYKLGESQMWWNSNIFSPEGLLYMKSMFPNSYDINMILTAMRTAKKIEKEYLGGHNNAISYYNLTDELDDSIEKVISILCDTNHEDMIDIIEQLISINDPTYLTSVFDKIEGKRPETIEPPTICFGTIKYDSLFNNNQINFKELNTELQSLLLAYQNSEQKLLNVGYYNLL